MKTMMLIETKPRTEELMTVSDAELESWFADAGLTVRAVTHCDSGACVICFEPTVSAARAA
jgi:hypothetical protein